MNTPIPYILGQKSDLVYSNGSISSDLYLTSASAGIEKGVTSYHMVRQASLVQHPQGVLSGKRFLNWFCLVGQ